MENKNDLLSQLRIDRDTEPQKHSPLIWLVPGALGLLALLAVIWWLASPSPITVSTTLARASTLDGGGSAVLNATGYVTARRYATVSSKVTGKVMEVLVEEGMFVEEGQVVARLDDINQQRQLALTEAEVESSKAQAAEAEARLTEARQTLERAEAMAARNLISHAELDAARSNQQTAEAQHRARLAGVLAAERHLAVQQQHLDDLIIRAPFAGVVVAKNAQPGEIISPMSAGGGFTRTGICSLVDMSSLEIEVDVNEAYIQRVLPGQPVQATLDAYPEWRIPARVIAIIPTADRQRATVRVRVGFDELDERILPDMGVRVAFLEAAPADNTAAPRTGVRVPASAVQTEGRQHFVFVVHDNVAHRRQVTLADSSGRERLIVEGLNPGEYFVNQPPQGLRDGARVKQ